MMRRGCPAGSSSTHVTLEGLRRKKRRQYAGVDDTASNKQRHLSPSRTLTRRDPSIRPLDFPFGRCGIGTGKTSPAAFLPFAPSSSSSLLLSSIQFSICFHHHVILLSSSLSIPVSLLLLSPQCSLPASLSTSWGSALSPPPPARYVFVCCVYCCAMAPVASIECVGLTAYTI